MIILSTDVFNLSRFVRAQYCYNEVKKELLNGEKRSQWMWFIFPQLDGLGGSYMSALYSIKNKEEALAYFNHELLGPRLVELCNILLSLDTNNATEIFGFTDSLKLKSSMTLFLLSTQEQIFKNVLDKFFDGVLCDYTIQSIA